MQQIDLEPKKHSHLYELKPASRWWLIVPICGVALAALVGGIDNVAVWCGVIAGLLLGLSLILVFPRAWLSRLD